jgi:hypothetical protein
MTHRPIEVFLVVRTTLVVKAVLNVLVGFCHIAVGFTNHQLVELVGALLGEPYAPRQATYDLRRLIRERRIIKVPHAPRALVTPPSASSFELQLACSSAF